MHFERKSLDRPTMKYISFFITYCICLSIGFCLLFSVQSSFAKDSSDEDVSWYEQFINSIGETLYFMAWPTATYEKVSFKGISRTNDGVNIKVKLHGKSAFDESSLWTEVILVINSGGVKDIRWRKHNGIIAEPGETMTNFVKLLDE